MRGNSCTVELRTVRRQQRTRCKAIFWRQLRISSTRISSKRSSWWSRRQRSRRVRRHRESPAGPARTDPAATERQAASAQRTPAVLWRSGDRPAHGSSCGRALCGEGSLAWSFLCRKRKERAPLMRSRDQPCKVFRGYVGWGPGRLEQGATPFCIASLPRFLGKHGGWRSAFKSWNSSLGAPISSPLDHRSEGVAASPSHVRPSVWKSPVLVPGAFLPHAFAPEYPVALQAEIDHAADAALDGPAAQRQALLAKCRILQTPRFPMLAQAGDLRENTLVCSVHLSQSCQLLDHAPPLAVPQQFAMLTVQRHPFPIVQPQRRQSQGNVVSGMAAVQDFVDRHPVQFGQPHDRRDSVPNPSVRRRSQT